VNHTAWPEEFETTSFALHLKPGCEEEYLRRHHEIWPEMQALLLSRGVVHYEIGLHKETHLLFAFIVRRKDHTMDTMADHPVAQRWRAHMTDILETETGIKPIIDPLVRMFSLSAPAVMSHL
jgi:L-rhamnose mutarotase